MSNIYEWLNRDKARFYKIKVEKENSLVIVAKHHWGSLNSNRGGKKELLLQSDEECQKLINNMIKRRKSRGYELISPSLY